MELYLDEIFNIDDMRMDDETFEEFLREHNLVLTSDNCFE